MANRIFKEILFLIITEVEFKLSLEHTKYTIIARNFTVHVSFSDELVEEGAQQHGYLNRDRYTRVPYGFTSTMVYPWNTSETARLQNRPRTIVPLFNLFIFESRPCDSGRSLIVAYNRSRQIARRFALSFSHLSPLDFNSFRTNFFFIAIGTINVKLVQEIIYCDAVFSNVCLFLIYVRN